MVEANSIDFASNEQELSIVISNKNDEGDDYFEISISFDLRTAKGKAHLWYADMSEDNAEPAMLLGSEMEHGVTSEYTQRDTILDRKPVLKEKTREFIQSAISFVKAYGNSGGEETTLRPFTAAFLSRCEGLMRVLPVNGRPNRFEYERDTGGEEPQQNEWDVGDNMENESPVDMDVEEMQSLFRDYTQVRR
jgi:hypothetical protein